MSDVERILTEAEQARAEAEAAARRAEELAARAEVARRRVAEEREARQRVWAQQVIDAYDADLTAAETAIQETSGRFDAAAEDPAAAVKAYLAWAEAATRHYTLQVRAATVAPLVGLEATEPVSLPPPPFSRALDAALDRRVAALSTRLRDEAAEELGSHLDAPPEAGGPADGAPAPALN